MLNKLCRKTKEKHIWTIVISICLALFMLCVNIPVYAAEEVMEENSSSMSSIGSVRAKSDANDELLTETVRVGFFAFDGYHAMDENGVKSGYGYDFLRLVSRYANLNFEYIGYDQSWEEMQQMLLDGEIDLLTSARKTAEREEIFDFSSPIGSSSIRINTKSNETRFVQGDYATYDGMTLGLLAGSSSNEKIEKFAEENGFSFVPSYYGTTEELVTAMEEGEVDAVATTSLRKTTGETTLSEFDTEYFYAIVKKGNKALLNQINEAIAQMNQEDNDWCTTLYNDNYEAKISEELEFTEEEQAYIRKYSTEGKTLVVATDTKWSPFSIYDEENQTYTGIVPDYWDSLMEMCGINYIYYEPDDGENIYDANVLEEGKAQIYLAYTWDESEAEEENLLCTDAYLDAEVAYVTRKGVKSIKKIAIAETTPMLNSKLDLPSSMEVISYEDSAAAIRAVRDGKADASYVYAYDAQKKLNADNAGLLTYSIIPGLYMSAKMVIPSNTDHTLISILCKCINRMSATDVHAIITENISYQATEENFFEYLQLHPKMAFLILMLIMLIIISLVVLFFYFYGEKKHLKEQRAQEEEYRQKIEKANHELRLTLTKEEQYRQATIAGAIMTANINVTKNLVEDEIYEKIGDEWKPVLATYGLPCPCPLHLYNKTVSERRVAEDSRETYLQAYDRERLLLAFVKGEMEHSFEYVRLQKENSSEPEIVVRHTILLMRDPDSGDVIGFCSAKDVSKEHMQQKELEKALLESKEADVLSAIHGALGSSSCQMHFDENGELLTCKWSEDFRRRMSGTNSETVFPNIIDSWTSRLHPEDCERTLAEFWDTVRDYTGVKKFHVDFRLLTAEKRYCWFRASGQLVRRADGRPITFYGVLFDIDEQKKNQNALIEAKKKQADDLTMIAGLSHEYYILMMLHTEDFRIEIYQDNYYRMHRAMADLGIDGEYYEAFINDYIERFVVPADRERVRRETSIVYLSQRIPYDEIYTVNFRRMSQDGQVTYHQLAYAKAITDDGKENWALGLRDVNTIMRDEQRQKKQLQDALDEAQNANRAKTMLLNNMSHDIRTPMNAIVDYTDLAKEHINEPGKVADCLQKISVSTAHLLSLINDVLDMGRIENGTIHMEEKEVYLPEILKDIRTIVQADVKARNLEFFIDTGNLKSKTIITDKFRLSQILLNLVNNAVKYTTPGGTVSLSVQEKAGPLIDYAKLEFCVADTGVGMSEEFKEHVFEPFAREEKNIAKGIGGTGIGMTITKNIVEMMGGSISVESEVGKGSEFIVSIPFMVGHNAKHEEQKPNLNGIRVLVVDDDAQICLGISKTVREMGLRSDWTSSGREALLRTKFAIDQKDPFMLFIIDGSMLDMDGIEVTRQIAKRAHNSRPKILITAYDPANIEKEAREAGATAFCSKPLFMSELKDTILQMYKDE